MAARNGLEGGPAVRAVEPMGSGRAAVGRAAVEDRRGRSGAHAGDSHFRGPKIRDKVTTVAIGGAVTAEGGRPVQRVEDLGRGARVPTLAFEEMTPGAPKHRSLKGGESDGHFGKGPSAFIIAVGDSVRVGKEEIDEVMSIPL